MNADEMKALRNARREKWDMRFLQMACMLGKWSKDRSDRTPGVGSVIVDRSTLRVVSVGYNGFPAGINDDIAGRHERPEKYQWTVHAEANAIAGAAQLGIRLAGTSLYSTQIPCSGCMALLIQAGIQFAIFPNFTDLPEKWLQDCAISIQMAQEAGVITRIYESIAPISIEHRRPTSGTLQKALSSRS